MCFVTPPSEILAPRLPIKRLGKVGAQSGGLACRGDRAIHVALAVTFAEGDRGGGQLNLSERFVRILLGLIDGDREGRVE